MNGRRITFFFQEAKPDQCFINFAECSWGWKMEILDYASVACLLQMLRVVYYSFYCAGPAEQGDPGWPL